MSDSLGIRFYDDKATRTGAHDVPLDFKLGTAAIPGQTNFPIAELHRLKDAIRTVALQDVSDKKVEPTEILENPDNSILISVGSTLLAGQIDKVSWPVPTVQYTKAAALDFCDGIDREVPLPPPAP